MKHIIEFSQIEFFKQHQYLELEGLLSDSRFKVLEEAIARKKSEVEKKYLDRSEQFLHMHDLFRDIVDLKKFLTGPVVAHILANLTNEKYFRVCFDQLVFYPQ